MRCTCRAELHELFPQLCTAEFHHWQALLEDMPGASITWREDDLAAAEDDVCHCRACMPEDGTA